VDNLGANHVRDLPAGSTGRRTRESANAANDKVLEFVQASLPDLNLGHPEIIAGEVLVNIESDA
jgi:hypothetical protein